METKENHMKILFLETNILNNYIKKIERYKKVIV